MRTGKAQMGTFCVQTLATVDVHQLAMHLPAKERKMQLCVCLLKCDG